MPVIVAALTPLLVVTALLTWISRPNPGVVLDAARLRREFWLIGLELVTFVFAVVTIYVSCSVSNTPLTDSIQNVYQTAANGYHESTNIPSDDNLKGSILIYFKPGCPDCAAVWPELTEMIAEATEARVYLVNTKSPTGRRLLEKYPVKEVPSGTYIAYSDNNTQSFHEVLYQTTDAGTTFRAEALRFLFRCQVQEW